MGVGLFFRLTMNRHTLHKERSSSRRAADLSDVDAIILAGGLGTRLYPSVSDRPKVLAEVGGRPFLDMLIENLLGAGVQRIILSVGYLKDHIKNRYARRGIFFAEEESPLGTGGGIKNAERFVKSDHFFVLNGDSWITGGADLRAIHDFHKKKNALATVVLARPRDEKDYGAVSLKSDGKISRFNEKTEEGRVHFMNAGVYIMNRKVFGLMPHGPFSVEADFFPRLIGGDFYGFPIDGEVVDIGTPERYMKAKEVLL